jgi:hypothetical protein
MKGWNYKSKYRVDELSINGMLRRGNQEIGEFEEPRDLANPQSVPHAF